MSAAPTPEPEPVDACEGCGGTNHSDWVPAKTRERRFCLDCSRIKTRPIGGLTTAKPQPEWRTIKGTYATKCGGCSKRLPEGRLVRWSPRLKVSVCLDCAARMGVA